MQSSGTTFQPPVHREAPVLDGAVITIGAFDGVHLGHQALVRGAQASARRRGLPLVVWTFDPPPKVFFGRATLLCTAHEKVARIGALGVDHVVLSHFDAAFRARTAAEFIAELNRMNPAEVWVGDDFRFGAMQAGDVDLLARHFPVRMLDPVHCEKGERISSSRIRNLWRAGQYDLCRTLLGWQDQFIHPEYELAW